MVAVAKACRKAQRRFRGPEPSSGRLSGRKRPSFTVVTRSSKFSDHLFRLTGRTFGREGLITFAVELVHDHPLHFAPVYPGHDGAKGSIRRGYGLRPENTGDFIAKKMADCSGRELLEETLRQLGCVANFVCGRGGPGTTTRFTPPANKTAALDVICPSPATDLFGSCA